MNMRPDPRFAFGRQPPSLVTAAPPPFERLTRAAPRPLVEPTASHRARIASEDARVLLASRLRALQHPGRIAVALPAEQLAEIIAALEA